LTKTRWWDRLLGSRAGGVLLLGGFVFCVYLFGRGWFARPSPQLTPTLEAIEYPALDGLEPICRTHLQNVRDNCEAIIHQSRVPVSHRARAFGELGKVYQAYDFSPSAVSCFRNATLLDPDDFMWWYCLALAHEQAGQTSEAIAAMTRAVQNMRTDLRAEPRDMIAALCFTAEFQSRLDRVDEATANLEEVLKIQPQNVYALAKLGQLASQAGRHAKAIDYLQRALALDKNHSGIRYYLAAAYRQNGDVDRATAISAGLDPTQKVQSLYWPDPIGEAVASRNLSSTRQVRQGARHMTAGQYNLAMPFFVRALEANPDNTEARTQYGLCLLNLRKYEEASQQLEQALQKDAGQDKARWGLCMAYASVPATRQKAVEVARAWQKAHPESLTALQLLAEVYAKEHRYQEAHDAFAEAIRRDPAQPWARLGKGVMLAALTRYVEARQCLQEAAETFPTHDQLRHNLARLLVTAPDARARDPIQGLKLSQEIFAAQANPIRAETLALALAENGRVDEALKQQEWAIQHYGNEGGPVIGNRLQAVLHSLQAKKAFREPWPFSDPDLH
jgi:tetratricopeptide (TPR) repeat protein